MQRFMGQEMANNSERGEGMVAKESQFKEKAPFHRFFLGKCTYMHENFEVHQGVSNYQKIEVGISWLKMILEQPDQKSNSLPFVFLYQKFFHSNKWIHKPNFFFF